MSTLVKFELNNEVATITMNDGRLNLMTLTMLRDLGSAFERAEKQARVLVLRSGVDGIFSAGFDLKVFKANDAQASVDMVRSGAELAVQLMNLSVPTVGVLEGHAFPMGTFLLLACDYRIGADGPATMGLNEVAIGITPPAFAIELARSRVHPAWLNRTVTLGEMFEPQEGLLAGFLDSVVAPARIGGATDEAVARLSQLHLPSHIAAKLKLRAKTTDLMRDAIDTELTLDAYRRRRSSSVRLPS